MNEGGSYSILAANPSTCFRQFLFLHTKKSAKRGLRVGAKIRLTALKRSHNTPLSFFLRTIIRPIHVYMCTWKIPFPSSPTTKYLVTSLHDQQSQWLDNRENPPPFPTLRVLIHAQCVSSPTNNSIPESLPPLQPSPLIRWSASSICMFLQFVSLP